MMAAKEPIYNSGVVMSHAGAGRTLIESVGSGGSIHLYEGMMLLLDTDLLLRRAGSGVVLHSNSKLLMENSTIRSGGEGGSDTFMSGIAMERSQAFVLGGSKIAGFKYGVSAIGQGDSMFKSFRSYYCVTGGKVINDSENSISHNLGDSQPDAATLCQ